MVVSTAAEPKISIGFRSGAVVRNALPLRANVVTPGSAKGVDVVLGGAAVPRASPLNFSDATATAAGAREQLVLRRKQSYQERAWARRKPVSAAGHVEGGWAWSPT